MRTALYPAHVSKPFQMIAAVVLLLLCAGCGGGGKEVAANSISTENAKSGTIAWRITRAALDHEIEGYASLTSVNRSGTIRFFVSTTAPGYTMRFFRLGWYGGLGGREVASPVQRTGTKQPAPLTTPVNGMIECRWTDPYVLNIPSDWFSGVYLAQLITIGEGKQSYIVFVVRDDARASDLLFQCAVNTYQAYNNWGGKSLYDTISSGGRARKVSFNRPYASGNGAGQLFFYEINMLRFVEQEGYDVTYCTDVDTHQNPGLLLSHRALLFPGHDEYWSLEMRDNVEAARDRGVHLGFFSANICYWRIRYEPSEATGDADRTVVCYKNGPEVTNPSSDGYGTILWRSPPNNRPEDALIGVMFSNQGIAGDVVIYDPSHWVCAGTGLQKGECVRGLLGYEADRMFGNAPKNITVIAQSPYTCAKGSDHSDMTVYTATSGAIVFAAGTMQWCWGLDDYHGGGKAITVQPAAQQMTRNVLARFISRRPIRW
jgi:hypothetical protein